MADLTVRDLVPLARERLAESGIEDSAGEARRLVELAIGVEAGRLTLHLDEPVSAEQQACFDRIVAERAARVPMSHLRGYREFWGRRFAVTSDVLDPRPDTEALIVEALSVEFETVLDLGTGSGCILLTVLAERLSAIGVGVDLSEAALTVARRNAEALGVQRRCELRQSDWFAGVTGAFDLIVSNPPYIAADEMAGLAPEVRDHEPHLALTDGADGLSAYRIIVAGAGAFLRDGGALMVEIGPTQGAAVCELFTKAGYRDVTIARDLDARDRVVRGFLGG
jgi:release factor glutamine methyltransferase